MMVKLKEVCTKIGSGATPMGGNSVYVSSGTSFIRSQNVYNLYFDHDGLAHITEDAADKLKGVTVQSGDVLINITGDSVARTCVVPSDVLPARVSQHVAIVRPNEDIIRSRFLNYYLASPYMQANMLGQAVGKGTSRNAMTKEMLGNFEVPCPKIELQDRIVSTLSAYDFLIENNQKQIKLLEEAAQRLYKEWFVDLRFPGYEDMKIVDGVPEGWKRTALDSIAFEVGKKEKRENREKYNCYLPIDCLPKKSLTYTQAESVLFAESSLLAFGKGDIIFGAMRPYFHKVVISRDIGLTRSTCFVLNARNPDFWGYLAMLMFSADTIEHATAISVGTTMPYVRWKDLKQMTVYEPSVQIAKAFNERIKNITAIIQAKAKQIVLLQQARDGMLPKLMNGELEV